MKKTLLFLQIACVVTPVLSLIGLILALFMAPSGSPLILIFMGATIVPGGLAFILFARFPPGSAAHQAIIYNQYYRDKDR